MLSYGHPEIIRSGKKRRRSTVWRDGGLWEGGLLAVVTAVALTAVAANSPTPYLNPHS